MALKYTGHTLSDDTIQKIAKVANKHDFPLDYAITLLHFEGLWGNSEVAKLNNNWGGMTWTGDPLRPSGIRVSKGTARPANEGGHYMRYSSVDDFLEDWAYLLRDGGIYKVSGTKTFDEAIKGMFKVGGAKYNYAASGYDHYLKGMRARREAINQANNGALDKLDNAKESNKGVDTMQGTAQAMISEAQKMVGVSHGSSAYNKMVQDYNNNLAWAINNGGLSPKPRNVNLSSNPSSGAYDWCAGFISVMAKRSGNIGTVGYEIAAERLGKQQHQSRGSWLGRVRPKAGDLVLFRWTGAPGWADHIGLVESVSGNTINTIEGNVGSPRSVRRRSYAWNDSRITGYGRPKYRTTATKEPNKPISLVAQEVINGLWGNGSERTTSLKNAGYDANKVQEEVNKLLSNEPDNKKTNEEIAKEVIAGEWGNNPERSKKLIEAGYDVNAVQKIVNELLNQPKETENVEVVEEEPTDNEEIKLEDNEFTIDGRVYVVNLKE